MTHVTETPHNKSQTDHERMATTLAEQFSDSPEQNPGPLKIGNVNVVPPVLQAPMAGYTNFAFRQVVREFGGAGLLATEMIAARSAIWLESNRGEHPDRLWGSTN